MPPSSRNPPRLIDLINDLMPSPVSFEHLGLGRGYRSLVEEWACIRQTIEAILNRNYDTSLYTAIFLIGFGNSQVHGGGPKVVFISMMQESDASEWPEAAEEIQDFLDTIAYGLLVRMEYDGALARALRHPSRRNRPGTQQQVRLQGSRS